MNFNQLETKGDYIDYCLSNCSYIRSIDPAIPLNVRLACKDVNTPTSNLVTIYYDTGEICYENIVAKACITNRINQLKEKSCNQYNIDTTGQLVMDNHYQQEE